MAGPVSFIVVFGLLIFVHELGHLVAAKAAGVAVEEFGFGYPPRLARLGTWGGTDITLNWIPFGGFVRMHEDDPDVPGGLAGRGRLVRALVLSAGALMNLLLAIVLFSVLFVVGALTPVERPGAGIYVVAPNSPAEAAGLQPGDNLLSIAGETINSVDQAVALIQANLGKPVEVIVSRNGAALAPVQVTPRVDPPPNQGALGVSLDLPLERQSYPVYEAVPMGVQTTWRVVQGLYYALRAAVAGQAPFTLSGPVGIYQHTAQAARSGIEQLIELTGMLSVNLFVLNLLPLPALDGGRLIFVLLEWVRGGRRIPPNKEGLVHMVGMMLLIALMVAVTFADISRLIG